MLHPPPCATGFAPESYSLCGIGGRQCVARRFPQGAGVAAKGQVAWVSSEGLAGIALQTLRGKGKEQLDSWLAAREQLN